MPRSLSDSRTIRGLTTLIATGGIAAGIACSEATAPAGSAKPAAPQVAPQAFIPGPHRDAATAPVAVVNALTNVTPFGQDSAVTFTVDPRGTTLRGPGVTVTFPAGFVAAPTQFTVTRKAGSVVAYDFQPSGTFTKPVIVTLSIAGAPLPKGVSPSALQGAYVQDWSQVGDGTATVDEFVPTTVDAKGKNLTMTLSHFSGYMVSWSRF